MRTKDDLKSLRKQVVKELANCQVKLIELENKLWNIDRDIWDQEKEYPIWHVESVEEHLNLNKEDKKNDL